MMRATVLLPAALAAVVLASPAVGLADKDRQATNITHKPGMIPKISLIQNWSSTGGAVEHKKNDKDLIYKVKQGDKLDFSITATAAQGSGYKWKVMQGSKVLSTSTKGNAFTWTVPSEKSTWEIEIEVTNPKGRDCLSWSITTSDLKTASPGDSIQKAIDSLPKEGGIVELAAGTFTLNSTLRIKRSGVTFRGSGMDKTIIQGDSDMDLLLVSGWPKGGAAARKGLPWGKWPDAKTFISNILVENMWFRGKYDREDRHTGITLYAVNGPRVSEVRLTDHAESGMFMSYCRFITVTGCNLEHNGGSIFPHYVTDSTITGNKISKGHRSYAGICLNCTHNMRVSHNTVANCANTVAGIAVYGTTQSRVFENLTESNGVGIWVFDGGGNKIERNTIKKNRRCGIYVTAYKQSMTARSRHYRVDTFRGNLIYDNLSLKGKGGGGGHGIHIRPTLAGEPYPLYPVIESNTIYGNAGDGIRNESGQHGVIKNNIVAGNHGYGINGAGQSLSHNNIWGNKEGNYRDLEGGKGSMSENPLFADASKGDFHLKSGAGRFDGTKWVRDEITSPCIDAGEPESKYGNEPKPNGGRINLGAYGNTAEASRSVLASPAGLR